MSFNRLRGGRVSFRVGSDRVQVEDILETFGGEDHDSTEQWPTLEEIRDAQQRMTAEEGAILGITERDGLWYAPQGEGIFVPAEPDDLRIRLMVVGHAGHAGHLGMDNTSTGRGEIRPVVLVVYKVTGWWDDPTANGSTTAGVQASRVDPF